MALLIINLMMETDAHWRAAINAELPDLEVRFWPDIGDPTDIEYGDYTEGLTLSISLPIFKVLKGDTPMPKKAPGRADRDGLTIVQLMDMFPTENAASEWFESVIWPGGRHCPKCGSLRTREASHKKMPYLVH